MRFVALRGKNDKSRIMSINELYDLLTKSGAYDLVKDKFTILKTLEEIIPKGKPGISVFFAIFSKKSTGELILISAYGGNIWNIINAAVLARKYDCSVIVTGCQTSGVAVKQIELLDKRCSFVNKTASNIADARNLLLSI